eukprot:320024_1
MNDMESYEWTIGSLCEVYSKSEQTWFKGEVVGIFKDKEGLWLKVIYNQNRVKEIQPHSQDIRYPPNKQPTKQTNKRENKDSKSHSLLTNSTQHDHESDETISVNEIDEILDEIEARKEEKDAINIEWNQILNELKMKNFNFVKNLMTSKKIDINEQNPFDGKTILIYAVIIGSLELVTVICNYGGDVRVVDNDGLTALEYAMRYGRLKITKLLFYRTLSDSLGTDLKHIVKEQQRQIEEAEYILQADIGTGRSIIK